MDPLVLGLIVGAWAGLSYLAGFAMGVRRLRQLQTEGRR